ncbi:hypothetical protein OAP32_00375 [Crocinitomicaceae bacterium]|nr:hypothetical protein [Crocinitomicaceae bacterium]
MKNIITSIAVFLFVYSFSAQYTLNSSPVSGKTYLSSTGNNTLDRLIQIEKNNLEVFFNVNVDLKIYAGSNGLASNRCSNHNCNGTIALGKHLLLSEFYKRGPKTNEKLGQYMIVAILAHEFAHIYQYKHPELKFKNSVIQEIHADMLAGWYMSKYLISKFEITNDDFVFGLYGNEKMDGASDIMSDMRIGFGWMGDEQYWSPQHHGDYFTRLSAFGEAWRCMRGFPVQISCNSFSEWLKDSIWLAELKYRHDQN